MVLIMTTLLSCKNDLSTIHSLTMTDSMPEEVAFDIELIYSDSGRIKAFLESPYMTRQGIDEPVIEFPDGFRVIFYDSASVAKSEITALYGIMYDKEKRMEAKNNVVVKNIAKDEMLETEHLIWERKKGIIYSDVFIKITKPNQVLFGEGLRSDETFDSYEIHKPTGDLTIYPDENEPDK
jgi:LPS export ABC transporter protein LptC